MSDVLSITLKKSKIGTNNNIRAILVGLGLTKREKSTYRENTAEIRGMLMKVKHLVSVEEVLR